MRENEVRDIDSPSRAGLTPDEVMTHVRELLEAPEDDLPRVLLKEMLLSVLKLQDAHADTLDLKILNRALKELRHSFRVFQEYRHRPKVSVFGSARTQSSDPAYELAHRFAHRMVESGYMVITGGADGIMRACQEGAGREQSFGINIMLPFEQGANDVIADDRKLINFKYFFTRKLMFVKESSAIALFPGGFGTHDEGYEVLTLAQTGKSNPLPIVCLQPQGFDYWDQWHAFIQRQLLDRQMINAEDLSLYKICRSEDEAVQEILTFYRTYHSARFVGRLMTIRMNRKLTNAQVTALNTQFADLLGEGQFEQRAALPEEFDEPALKDLPRLTFVFNRRSAGRLRQLIDHLNGL